jgi:hypothetical protein
MEYLPCLIFSDKNSRPSYVTPNMQDPKVTGPFQDVLVTGPDEQGIDDLKDHEPRTRERPRQTQTEEPTHPQADKGDHNTTEPPRPLLSKTKILKLVKKESTRLLSFAKWSKTSPRPEELARAGFFYFNTTDRVQCAFCLGIVGHWEAGDLPMVEHRRHFPRCPFLRGLPVGNVPLGVTKEAIALRNMQEPIPQPQVSKEEITEAEPERGWDYVIRKERELQHARYLSNCRTGDCDTDMEPAFMESEEEPASQQEPETSGAANQSTQRIMGVAPPKPPVSGPGPSGPRIDYSSNQPMIERTQKYPDISKMLARILPGRSLAKAIPPEDRDVPCLHALLRVQSSGTWIPPSGLPGPTGDTTGLGRPARAASTTSMEPQKLRNPQDYPLLAKILQEIRTATHEALDLTPERGNPEYIPKEMIPPHQYADKTSLGPVRMRQELMDTKRRTGPNLHHQPLIPSCTLPTRPYITVERTPTGQHQLTSTALYIFRIWLQVINSCLARSIRALSRSDRAGILGHYRELVSIPTEQKHTEVYGHHSLHTTSPTIVSTIYLPPKLTADQIRADLESLFQAYLTSRIYFNDTNAQWTIYANCSKRPAKDDHKSLKENFPATCLDLTTGQYVPTIRQPLTTYLSPFHDGGWLGWINKM